MSSKTVNPWDLDIRVRDRNLQKGIITERDVEKHKSQLTDLAAETDKFVTWQPGGAVQSDSGEG